MKNKSIFILALCIMMALVMTALPSLQVAAESTHDEPQKEGKYISEIKIGIGETAKEAEEGLKEYTILKEGNSNVDLNQNAGGGIGSKGERVVYLGYKTTDNRSEAVTDLAVMNMKGGYSVKDYEMLMDQQMTEQIIPMVDNLLISINEYRENYDSDIEENRKKAQYIHDELNKLTDDDCNNAGLGDLLLNQTKYEMGDEAYDALPDEEKVKHADILTIFAQANGKATLTIINLLTKACDTDENTWIDRFIETSYEDLIGLYGDMLPSDAENAIAKEYDDGANMILDMWDPMKETLDSYDENVAKLDELMAKDLSQQQKLVEEFDFENATDEQAEAFGDALAEITAVNEAIVDLNTSILLTDCLRAVDYQDGTLADFFAQDSDIVANDKTLIYPLIASLSEGQKANLEFITLSELIMLAMTDSDSYKEAANDDAVTSSIYEDVDRDIYKKGGVGLTNEALRSQAAEETFSNGNKLSLLSYIMLGVAGASGIALTVTAIMKITAAAKYNSRVNYLNGQIEGIKKLFKPTFESKKLTMNSLQKATASYNNSISPYTEALEGPQTKALQARNIFCSKLLIGASIVFVVFSSVALFITYMDLKSYYDVDLTPIPHYIVDEKDITAYNDKGEKTVIKNLAAYYKAVSCNRPEDDEWYDILGTCADLNATVGRQWLALYAAKNEDMKPILASSLKAVIGSTDVPPTYTTGIHMFSSSAAYNLNNTQYIWNNKADSIFVYFNYEGENETPGAAAGSAVSTGYIALTAIAGLLVGILSTLGVTYAIRRKKKNSK